MRASKEQAETARQNFARICDRLDRITRKDLASPLANAVGQVAEFLNVAKRRLPTEAAYDRDTTRRKR